MLTPLRDNGYWEGAAAPCVWKMIDDIERRLESAAKVANGARRVVEDGVGDLKSAQKVLKDATRRAKEKDPHINADGTLSPDVIDKVCKVELTDEEKKTIETADREIARNLRRGVTSDRNLA
ncbi:hypothetical protein [Streptomyces sp. NPDC093260]|uniref:hypothetical protein n=1 Tax=Streptomyces sp. NPDC093260 TaxID=3155073 RepID=UPI003443FF84